ncbi:Tol-Pal system protein TolB [Ideonella sp. B7]|uniref:Tol-Pal system beta propeller repeat protein TolB n=1 Tax=Ideonella benzenivorans TaxID=2831643 RepID=UPI001CECECBF|nr:Tol-Pal system beta propeller repeat protein TolB [Ideonella benzenivorans]MCA6216611.1 Tol-Pal system protein TolB [Ideonella benzenivorans]
MWNRRHALGTLAALGGLNLLPARAQFRVEIAGIGATQLPISLLRFRGESSCPQPISQIIRADLERSGRFRFVDTSQMFDETGTPAFADLRTQGSDAIAAGSVTKLVDGRYDVRYKLWDVVKGADLGGQSYPVPTGDLRLAAHRIADAIYEKLTGERGVFATRIVYVTKGGGRYSLRVADADGEGGQVALVSPEPIISPSWSPNGLELAYVSFEDHKPVVWVQNTATGARHRVANFRGSNSAPAWSPDGQTLAVTLSRQGGSQIYLISKNGGSPRRVTQSMAIDTEATFAPDGQTLYFVSDRGGSPQIYRQPVNGGSATRVTFSGNYNVSPAISPDGKTLAYVQRQGGLFKVMTMDLASGSGQSISDTDYDERPSFSPNGRLVMYATRTGGQEVLMTSTVDGKVKTRLLSSGQDIREPDWGPYGR